MAVTFYMAEKTRKFPILRLGKVVPWTIVLISGASVLIPVLSRSTLSKVYNFS